MATTRGAHSPKLDAVRALRTKHGRREQQRFAAEGPTMLVEALAASRIPEAVYATPPGLLTIAAQAARPELAGRIFEISEKAMARLSDLQSPPGVLAVHPLVHDDLETLLISGEPAVVLAGVADPGNAGTLVRAAEIFGIERVIFARDGVEAYNPKVVRATMGAVFRVRFAVAGPEELVLAARARGYVLVATTRDGIALPDFRFPDRALIAIGNERRGVASWLPRWDLGVSIPQGGGGESLNAAVAGGIIFYAFSQQVSEKISGS